MFEVLGEIKENGTIAAGRRIKEFDRLVHRYGSGQWRKLKGVAFIRLSDGQIFKAEIHWYEAHRIGKRELKIKNILE
ncbi:MAG: hypothetical protein MUP70_07560 [Candidatus Aminicenantes bacterium]|nr:hypothetical protein [Candidatus Aminicenantes bacterium]